MLVTCECRWLVPANRELDAEARRRYDSDPKNEPAQWIAKKSDSKNQQTTASKPSSKSVKKKKQKEFVSLPTGKNCFFLIDCETTGSKRNWDRGIEYCVIAYDKLGNLLEVFVSRVSNDGVRIKPAAYEVHGISYNDLRDAPKFSEVGRRLNTFFDKVLQDFDNGVLVAHNGATDFQFLCCDYQRVGLRIPAKITHTMCTLQTLRRFSSLAYRQATPEQWTLLTKTGKPSLCVKPCATFVLSKRSPPATFESECGTHHEALPDVKGVAVMLFDYRELGNKGIWHKVFRSNYKVCELLSATWAAMEIKMASPVVKIEPLPLDWISNDQEGIAGSCAELPIDVETIPEPQFRPRGQRGEGQPSTALWNHLNESGHCHRHVWEGNYQDLMLFLFLFFFPLDLLAKIALWTTLKATELVIKRTVVVKGKSKKTATRLTFKSSPREWTQGTPRMSQWEHPLTAGELLVWIGIRMRMGLLNKKRVSHYFSNLPGIGDPIIKAAMKEKRFRHISSCLSFARPSAPSGWGKFQYVNSVVRAACRLAVGITQHVAIDESMIKCFSRYCSWKQFMPRKPIKTGIKVFALVLSIGFLFDWHVFRGRSDPLCGKNAMYKLINDVLVTPIFDHCGCIIFCDAAFASIKLFRQLHTRGIYAVGPMNAAKPEKGANGDSWPHQTFKKGDAEYLGRGWDRTAYSKLDGGGWIQATVWRDNKFVKLLNTVYIVDGVQSVQRWVKTAAQYITIGARLVLKMYQQHMGHVDRMDKNVALCGIRLRRCKHRYHRQMFLWLIAAVAFNNVFVLFMMIFPLASELKAKHEKNGFGWKHYFQHELSLVLMKHGRYVCDVQRRETAGRVLFLLFRSGDWKTKWRVFHSKKFNCCPRVLPVATPAVVTPPVAGSRGRPKKKGKRGSGGGRNKRKGSPQAKPATKKTLKQRRLQRERLETYSFQSPPPFVPRAVGRKSKSPVGDTVFANGKTHTLVHSFTLGKWKSTSSFCVSCYAVAPPPASGRGMKKWMSDGSRIPQTSFACNICEKRLCKYCHHYVWGPHLTGGSVVPHGIVYSTEM